MERNSTLHTGRALPHSEPAGWRHEPHVANPPAGVRVLEQLSRSLPMPQATVSESRRGQVGAAHSADANLSAAYLACTQVIRDHSKSFYFSARLLPAPKRHGIMALYAFCRTSDDLVDAADASLGSRKSARISLDCWARMSGCQIDEAGTSTASTSLPVESLGAQPEVARAWTDTRRRHGIPGELADELLAGVRMDLTISRYETWDDLWLYCYRVASTVGLMSMYIMGAETMDAVPYAVQLGVALQLTNILRDVGEDARAGRLYLPAEDMARFGYTDEMLLAGEINRNFVALMDFQIARAHALYRSALPGIALLSPDSRLAVMAAATIYRSILPKIVAAKYDVFNHRAHLSAPEKLRALPAIWWRSKRATIGARADDVR